MSNKRSNLSERLRQHAELIENVTLRELREDMFKAARAIDRAVEALESHNHLEGDMTDLDEAARALRGD